MDYFVLTTGSEQGGVIDALPAGSPKGWKFHEGIPLAKEFPAKAALVFTPNFPKQRKLEDFQPNIMGLLIVSRRVRELLESQRVENAEFLPVAIKDHRKKVAAPDYSILNLLGSEDAIDLGRSKVEMDTIIDGDVSRVMKLVLNRKGIRPEAKMFRCTRRTRLVLVREDLRAAIAGAGLTGCKLVPAEGFDDLMY
ncbi:MAG TPA: DUF1629 domain-containing protein [Anaeromyxobacteraceae bacterium]